MSEFGERQNPHRLYRDKSNACLAGVCAGLGEYFGFNVKALRLITAIGALFFLPFVLVSYLILAIVLPVKPEEPELNEEEVKFWRGVSHAPSDVFSQTKHRFREMDRRLQRMEAFVTSREFDIDRELARSQAADSKK